MKPSAKQLRDRWKGEDARISAIIADIKESAVSKKHIDWTRHLIGTSTGFDKSIAYIDPSRLPGEGQAAPRDLRGIVLRDLDLSDTSGLADTLLDYALLDNVYLAGASLTGASLRCVTVSGNQSSFRGALAMTASFKDAACAGISFNDADLSNTDICGCDLRKADLRGTNLSHAKWNREGTFGALGKRWTRFGGEYQNMDNLNPKTPMSLRKYIAGSSAIMDLHREHKLLSWIWYLLANYGRSAGRLAVATVLCWLFFASMFFGRTFLVSDCPQRLGFGDALYLSAVTLTTLGYGDIVPTASDAWARFLVGAEAVSGIIIIGALIAILIENATINTD